jgi:hypothetical protein
METPMEFMTVDNLIKMLKASSVEEMKEKYPHGVKLRQIQPGEISYKWAPHYNLRSGNRRLVTKVDHLDVLTSVSDFQLSMIASEIPDLLRDYLWMFKPNSSDVLKVWMLGKRQDQAVLLFHKGMPELAEYKLTVLAKVAESQLGENHPTTEIISENLGTLDMIKKN